MQKVRKVEITINFSHNILNPINIKINDKAYSIIGNLFTIGAINK